MIRQTPFTSITNEQAATLTPQARASYLLVSSDGLVSSLGMPYWGGPTTPTPTVGMHIQPSNRGYALIGATSWQSFGPDAPAEPAWLTKGTVVRVSSDSNGCWALMTDETVHDPYGEIHEPPGSGTFIDFAISDKGVTWLDSNGALSGVETRSSDVEATAVSVSICNDKFLVVYSNGTIIGPNGTPDNSLNAHVLGNIVNATSKDESLWLVTAKGLVYGWGRAQHGGNLHAPRVNESIVALYV